MPSLRDLTRAVRVHPKALVAMLRVPAEGGNKAVLDLCARAKEGQLAAVYLAPFAKRRDDEGNEAWKSDAPFTRAVAAAKEVGDLAVFAELDLSAFLKSGRPGAVVDGWVEADAARENLGKAAITLAEAGADVVSVRGLVDGGVSAVREALEEAGLSHVNVLSLSVDLHGPLTELRPLGSDKQGDLLDPADLDGAMRQADFDVSEGADFLGVQPCLFSQDILRVLSEEHDLPLFARITDQEARAVEAMARGGMGSLQALVEALHTSLLRAGARCVVTPWTP